MVLKLYLILVFYFLIGAIGILSVTRKDKENSKSNWIKYAVYFLLINMLFFSIIFNTYYFQILVYIIVVLGFGEIVMNLVKSKKYIPGLITLCLYSLFSIGSVLFSCLHKELLLFTLFIVTVFDAMSQITGQLVGKNKLFPSISPNKTFEGFIGGVLFSLITVLFVKKLINNDLYYISIIGLAIAFFALTGDLLASLSKRKMGIKDFSNMLPGHGGVIDRFDSFIFSGAIIYLLSLFNLV